MYARTLKGLGDAHGLREDRRNGGENYYKLNIGKKRNNNAPPGPRGMRGVNVVLGVYIIYARFIINMVCILINKRTVFLFFYIVYNIICIMFVYIMNS